MIDLTIHAVYETLGHLGPLFQFAVCTVVLLSVLVFVALPTALVILSTSRHPRSGRLLAVNHWIGPPLSWLVLLLMLAQVAVVILRHVFDTGSVQLQESAWHLHGTIIMLGVGYTFVQQRHVRLDVWHRRLSERSQDCIDLIGHVLLLVPLGLALLWVCTSYIAQSWSVQETSSSIGGLGLIFIMKTMIGLFALLLVHFGVMDSVRLYKRLSGGLKSPNQRAQT